MQVGFAFGVSAHPQTLHTGAPTEVTSRTPTGVLELPISHWTRRRLLQVSANTPETTLVFLLTFAAQPSQSDAVVQTAVQYSIASANTPLPVSTSVVDMGSAAYNVTVLFPAGAQVSIDLLSDPNLAQTHPIAILCYAVDPARHTLLASLCYFPVMVLLKHVLHMTKNPFPTS